MSKLRNFMIYEKDVERINELGFQGNIGFMEMAEFYQKASKSEIKKMEEIIKNEDWESFRMIIKKVIGTVLK